MGGETVAKRVDRIRRYLVGSGFTRVFTIPGTRRLRMPGRPHGWLVVVYGQTPPDGHRSVLSAAEKQVDGAALRPMAIWTGVETQVGRAIVLCYADDLMPWLVRGIDQGGGE